MHVHSHLAHFRTCFACASCEPHMKPTHGVHSEALRLRDPALSAAAAAEAQRAATSDAAGGDSDAAGGNRNSAGGRVRALRSESAGTCMEFYSTGMQGVGSLKKDCALLCEWMHDPELWFHFTVMHDWFEREIDPTFFRLRSNAKIYPESGCHMGGQMVPRLALNAIVRAYDLPDGSCSDAQINAKVKEYLPLAHKHVHLTSDTQVGARNGFMIRRKIASPTSAPLPPTSLLACASMPSITDAATSRATSF